ncbi:MAG TPA: IscS subfamily cysteine desulfurase [Steroidobacteraceae bacterium]|nr:IscS subfamily cysteine desulfurase [Steroidobacteraceae bacterium]
MSAQPLPIYLDYAATTPVDPRVVTKMAACLGRDGAYGNAASLHSYGRQARGLVEGARQSVAKLVGAPAQDLYWTSGATEAINLALLGLLRGSRQTQRHLITARTEHKAVLDACRQLEREGVAVTYLPTDAQGLIDPAAVHAALGPHTVLVSILHANNEIGVVQDIAALARICRERGVALHVDAAQSAGKLPLDVRALGVDLLSLTAHKFYGPKGVGALYVAAERRPQLQPLLFGGGHERGLRSGTLPVHQIVGMGAAAEVALADMAGDTARLEALRQRLWQGLADLPGALLNGHPTQRLASLLNVSFEGVEGESLLFGLPELAVSTGSACNSERDEPSYVLRALGRDTETAQSSLRFSLGRFTTAEDIDGAIQAVRREVLRLRKLAP